MQATCLHLTGDPKITQPPRDQAVFEPQPKVHCGCAVDPSKSQDYAPARRPMKCWHRHSLVQNSQRNFPETFSKSVQLLNLKLKRDLQNLLQCIYIVWLFLTIMSLLLFFNNYVTLLYNHYVVIVLLLFLILEAVLSKSESMALPRALVRHGAPRMSPFVCINISQ